MMQKHFAEGKKDTVMSHWMLPIFHTSRRTQESEDRMSPYGSGDLRMADEALSRKGSDLEYPGDDPN